MIEGASDAALSLGSNLGDRAAHLARARAELAGYARAGHPGGAELEIVAASGERLTTPQGFAAQPDFLNQVLLVRTALSPWELLDACLEVERRLGRVRGPVRWGPRTIDVDILAYDGLALRDERLTLPHAALPLRPFFLEMLREIGAERLLP